MNVTGDGMKSSLERKGKEPNDSLEEKYVTGNLPKEKKVTEPDLESKEKVFSEENNDFDDINLPKENPKDETSPKETILKDIDLDDKNPSKENRNDEVSSKKTVFIDFDSDDKNSKKGSTNEESSTKVTDINKFDSDDKNSSEENSNAGSLSSKTDLENKNFEEENHFKNLFMEACDKFQKEFQVEDVHVDKVLTAIIDSFKTFTFDSLDFNLIENRLAYLRRYSLLLAASSRHRFVDAFINCEKLKTYINKSELNVISLGGGSAADMVAFCSAIQECRKKPIHLLNFCVVDLQEKWKPFLDITESLIREKAYGAASRIFRESNVCTSFMKGDLMDKNPSQKYNAVVRSADIVLLAKVLDSLNFKKTRPQDMLNNIAQRMKKDALLLLVDCHQKKYKYNKEILQRIYAPDLEKFTLKDRRPYAANESTTQIAVFVKT